MPELRVNGIRATPLRSRHPGKGKKAALYGGLISTLIAAAFALGVWKVYFDDFDDTYHKNDARGGLNYDAKGSRASEVVDWDVNGCKLARDAGAKGIDLFDHRQLLIAVRQNASGRATLEVHTPHGPQHLDWLQCDPLKNSAHGNGRYTRGGQQEIDGQLTFDCDLRGDHILGSVKFHRCGE